MAISKLLIAQSIAEFSEISGVTIQAEALVRDLMVMARVWNDAEDFSRATASTLNALKLIRDGKITPSKLRDKLAGYSSYHYQSTKGQGRKADMRVVYKIENGVVFVLGFGHRFLPSDIYRRLLEKF